MKWKLVKVKAKAGVRKVLTGINRGMIAVTCKIAGVFGYDDLVNDYMKSMCKAYEKNTDYYVAYKIRPKTQDKIFTMEEENEIDAQIGIVMQGPLFLQDHFTLETVRIYGKLFPSAKVIISTWKDQDKKELGLLEQEPNCLILLNDKPGEPGMVNSNMQRVSTLNGIRFAKNLGCKYVLKTRGDWRIYAKGALRFLVHLLDEYPCKGSLYGQKKRIIATDIATEETSIMFYPFWITDLLMFGDVDDMESYWDSDETHGSEYDKRRVDALIRTEKYTWKRRIEEGLLNETRIPMNYILRKTGEMPNVSVKEYWDFVRDYFIIVPKSLLDAFWFKYTDRRVNESADWGTCFFEDSEEKLLTYNFDFVSWMNLYHNDLKYKEEYERFCRERHYDY